MQGDPSPVLEKIHRHFEDWIDRLTEFVAIPSISGGYGRKEDLERAAEWVADCLGDLGIPRIEVFPTAGFPIVYAEDMSGSSDIPTILFYGHYDVTTVEPTEEWDGDPFTAQKRGENLFGRGTTDMKGQIIAGLAAVEAVRSAGSDSFNLKFLIEGEEEYSPRHLEAFLQEHAEMLQADFCLNPDAGMLARDTPTIVYSLRGNSAWTLTVRGPSEDLHTGLFGGAVHNPIHALAEFITKLHDSEGRVAIPHLYDYVDPISDKDRELISRLPATEAAFQKNSGVRRLWGEEGHSVMERVGARPSLNVYRLEAGMGKVVIPKEAQAKIGIRLVPHQKPEEVGQLLEAFVAAEMPETVEWDLQFISGYPPTYIDRRSPYVQQMVQALETTWGEKAVMMPDGGGIPAAAWMQEHLGLDSVLTGFATPDDNLHGPNEKVHLPTLKKGMEAIARFLMNITMDSS
jgi:acetylornithine deacetylase/succinyl-diaminopimelate desuccinylase-like protein